MLCHRNQVLTLVLMIVVSVIVVAYDVAVYRRGVEGTISVVCRTLFHHLPTLGVLFIFWLGVLVGHLFPTK